MKVLLIKEEIEKEIIEMKNKEKIEKERGDVRREERKDDRVRMEMEVYM